jgi:hypothetical protein
MNNNFWNFIGLIVFLAAAYITNPTEADFKEYISNELVTKHDNGDNTKFRGLQQEITKGILDLFVTVKSKDYKVCSVHTFDDLSGKRRKYLGLFTFFINIGE